MTIRTLFLIAIISLSLNVAMATNDLDDPEVRAAIAMLEAKSDIEHSYQFCRIRAGDSGYKYDYLKYLWELKNRPYLQLSERIFDDLPDSTSSDLNRQWKGSSEQLLSDRNSADSDDNGNYCTQYFSRLTTGSAQGVSASRAALASRLGAREEVRIIQRNIDMEVGCVKAGYNKDIKQFEGIKKACDCQTTLLVKQVSNREIDDYLALVAAKAPQDAVAFIGKRIAIEELQACYSQLGAQ